MKRTTIILLLLAAALAATAQDFPADSAYSAARSHWFSLHDITVEARLGYNIGGTAPLPIPATIRHLDRFPLTPNLTFGVAAYKKFDARWGLKLGVTFENKGMETDAQVKNYNMEIERGGQVLGGWFTGNVVTQVTQWMFTVPLQATLDVRKVRLRCGPYISYLTYRDFSGWAYDGYLRVDGPTGEKVELGHDPGERGDYDFSPHMRRLHWGLGIGADWYFHRRVGVFADLNWGFNGVHKSNFHTIEQTLRPIYGTIGITYRVN